LVALVSLPILQFLRVELTLLMFDDLFESLYLILQILLLILIQLIEIVNVLQLLFDFVLVGINKLSLSVLIVLNSKLEGLNLLL
jgi:hypothetical protein